MRRRYLVATLVTLSSVLASATTTSTLAAAASSAPAPAAVLQSSSPAAAPANQVGAAPPSEPIDFNVGLTPADPASAAAFADAVTDPSSPSYRHFLTPAEWESRFSPSQASVTSVTSWLKSQGITVSGVTPDRLTVQATGSAEVVQRAFATSLGEYSHLGRTVRLASGPLKVPANLASLISGVSGIDQHLAKPARLTGAAAPRATKQPATKEIPLPPGFRNAPPCSPTYAKKLDSTDPPYGAGYPSPLPYAVCGYTPPQLQGAYGLTSQIAGGLDGKGVTVAIVDAYVSPTLRSDAQEYSARHQPGQPLKNAQFSELLSKSFNNTELCEASEWYGEQTLDVEAVHATAPGAKILYVGAKNCVNGLYDSVQQVIDGHLASIITNSWGDGGGDLLDSPGSRRAFDNVLLMAKATGIGVQFSSGDEGDEFTTLGMTVADYPASSPYQTAVGGTSLQVGKGNVRLGELGWSTSKSTLCTPFTQAEELPGCSATTLNTWQAPAPGTYLYGGGGGTSYQYPEPPYQQGVVPAALAERNSAITHIPNRVEPDISMNGDPTTGMLVGETQVFPNGTYYDEYRIGGTSLASPLFAGEMALADQAAGGPLGFINPLLYKLAASPTSAANAFYDIVPAGKQALVRSDYVNGVDAKEGTLTSVRTLGYEGRETFCSGTGNCTHQRVALSAARGFDSMTGLGSPAAGLPTALAKP